MSDLSSYRKKIDDIDNAILKLLSERGRQALAIGKLKKKDGALVHVPNRELSIYERLSKLNKGPYPPAAVTAIFREIISASRALEAPLRVAYLGPQATFTHKAAVEHFGNSSELKPVSNIGAVFDEVEKKRVDYGVVPIENTTEGVVSSTLDRFVNSTLKVSAEVILPVSQNLLSREDRLEKIKTVYSHPQALAQCRTWLAINLPKAALKETQSTADAARLSARLKGTAAIASEIAASLYQIPILKQDIQDESINFTRFLVIGHQIVAPTGRDKTSILFMVRDEVGALYRILSLFARHAINLTKIESRPFKKKAWEYLFFVDMDGHQENKKNAGVLGEMKKRCTFFQILGSYPRGSEL